MKESEFQKALSAGITEAVDEALAPLKETIQKSSGAIEVEVNRVRPFSIAKYFRGAWKGNWTDANLEKSEYVKMNKALGGGIGSAGGFLVPPEYSSEIIELARAKAVVRSMPGVRTVNMKGDQLNIVAQSGAGTGYWVGENKVKTESEQEFVQKSLVLKKCAALTYVSNELLDDADPAVDDIIKGDLAIVLSLAEDIAFLEGAGGAAPSGLFTTANVQSTAIAGLVSYDNMLDAMTAIEVVNGMPNGWLMHPSVKGSIRKLKDGEGRYVWDGGDVTKNEPSSLFGLPIGYSTQISTTCNTTTGALDASGTSCSYIVLGDWTQFMIGQKAGQAIVIEANSSDTVSWTYDQTSFRAVLRTDLLVRQPTHFYILKATTY